MQPGPLAIDSESIRAVCQSRLAFCGLANARQALPFGTQTDRGAGARHRLYVIAPGGGYVLSPAHCVQAGTPLENLLPVCEETLGKRLK
ncbi:MAG TPA: hypothetical protein VNA25_17475 [Phycisphaerae bacterium]|nr:hypothetical protein [Phycisphaerae bacterium]